MGSKPASRAELVPKMLNREKIEDDDCLLLSEVPRRFLILGLCTSGDVSGASSLALPEMGFDMEIASRIAMSFGPVGSWGFRGLKIEVLSSRSCQTRF